MHKVSFHLSCSETKNKENAYFLYFRGLYFKKVILLCPLSLLSRILLHSNLPLAMKLINEYRIREFTRNYHEIVEVALSIGVWDTHSTLETSYIVYPFIRTRKISETPEHLAFCAGNVVSNSSDAKRQLFRELPKVADQIGIVSLWIQQTYFRENTVLCTSFSS